MVGYCPNCGKQILHIHKGKIGKPLGNYRSIKFGLKNGSYMECPFCVTCHDFFDEKKLNAFIPKLKAYLGDTLHESIDKDKYFDMLEIVSIKKLGPLSKSDLKGGKIWM